MTTRPLPPAAYLSTYNRMLSAVGEHFPTEKERLTPFLPLVGSNYRPGKGVLIVGRAVNRWGVADRPSAHFRAPGHRGKVIKTLKGDWAKETFDHWAAGGNGRRVQRSAFFRAASLILSDEENRAEWTMGVAWSNLFKVAPASGGNPNGRLRNAQRQRANELFHLEIISWLRPRTVLVMADEDWFDSFGRHEGLALQSVPGMKYVQGRARSSDRSWVLAKHPQGKP